MNGQPNFLLVITDQQQAGHLGCYGNRVLRTPHIDALAASGVRAERCYVASPICMPNRASLMTGRMPSVHGVRHNGIELSLGETTFVEALREAGWQTAIAGKSHLQCIHEAPAQVPPDPKSRLAREARRKLPGRYNQELGTAWEKNPAHDLFYPYYGFERAHLTVQHGDAQYGHWRRWLRSQLPDADRLIGPENATPTPGLELSRCRQAWRTRLPEELYPNAWITDRTIDLLREFARGGKPFFIQCSYPDPHHPFTPPGRYWSLYSPEDVPAPPSFHAEHRNVPPHVQWLHAMRDAGKAVKHTQAPFACSEREAREAIALNYGTISQIDDGVGRIEAELGRLGLERNTIVLFTSDHGDFMGDHQLLLKGPIHYRGLIRVPFIWKDPRGPSGRVTDSLVQTTDFAPTILERAGVAPWNGIQGKSLLAAFADDGKAPHESLLVEEEGQRVYLGFAGRVRMRSLVTRSHRLSIYDGVDWGELYDFADDPHECVNRWDDPGRSRVRAELVEQLAHRMLEYSETSPYPDYIA